MNDELILVEKDGQQIRVHPGTLENHKELGWKVVEEALEEPVPDQPAAAPVVKKAQLKRQPKAKK